MKQVYVYKTSTSVWNKYKYMKQVQIYKKGTCKYTRLNKYMHQVHGTLKNLSVKINGQET